MNNLLIPEPPLQVLPSLAKKLKSVDKAIMLQQIFYWQQKSTHVHDGYKWVYNTVKDWHKQFPWLSEKTVQRYLKDLEDKGFLITGNYNKATFDRTKWYRVNQIALDNLNSREGLRIPTKGTESSFLKGTDSPNQYHRIPETTSETTIKRNIKESQPSLTDRFETLWKLYPKKQGKQVAFRAYKRAVKKGTTDDEIKQGIVNYEKYIKVKHIDNQFIKQGSTWFNQNCWEDDYSVSSKPQEPEREWLF